jgi:phospholipase A1
MSAGVTRDIMSRYAVTLVLSFAWALSANAASDFEACVVQEVMEGDAVRTAAEIRQVCSGQIGIQEELVAEAPEQAGDTLIEGKLRSEADIGRSGYAVSLYQPNYIVFSHDAKFDAADSIYTGINPDFADLKQEEMKFQVSVLFPIVQGIFNDRTDLNVAYTQTSWWQLFSDKGISSAPFRETNYMPELFLRHHPRTDLPFGGKLSVVDLALVHQSNGRSDPLSRSWNRVIGRAILDYGELGIEFQAWYRLPEDREDDDNPDTEDYYGYGDIRASWAPNRNTFGVMFRPGKKESGLELSWSYPLTDRVRIFAQWWYGYGESMIDYDRKVNRGSIGFTLNDWLQN